ncbi:MAG TPA: sigma-70 family RNA polymerase sigma factor, partial [Oceanobacillus sp.]|nr:sigma-70 family RNA polymerase sigma factor [Oceanobacillus sp.]
DAEPDPHNTAEMRELQAAVRNALDQLSPGQRAAIVMRYYFDMSEEEMAAQFNAPPGTIRWRLHAARRRLRGLLHRTLSWEKG